MSIRREQLSDLLKRYTDGTCSAQEKQLIDSWFDDFHSEVGGNAIASHMQEFIWQKIQPRTGLEDTAGPQARRGFIRRPFLLTGIAASLLAGLMLFFQLRTRPAQPDILALPDLVTQTNTSGAIQSIYLEDSSRIDLRPGCTVRYPKPFAKDKREVLLTGEAFFEVTKNPGRPFTVYTGEVATKVVGTSFLVRAGKSRDVEVSVVTGKVIVERSEAEAREPSGNGVILTPNQKVTYYHNESHFVTGVVEQPEILQPRTELVASKLFKFEETPLEAVLEKLEYGYGIEFELLNDQIRNCPFTADLSDQPLYTKLDIITASLNAKYEVKGVRIVLSGGGCD